MHEFYSKTSEYFSLEIPKYVFTPNLWTEMFLEGIDKIDVKNKDILELGVGTGVMAIHLLRKNIRSYCGVDINPKILPIASRNILCNTQLRSWSLLCSNLLDELPLKKSFDLICGCLPQIAQIDIINTDSEDITGKYYNPSQYQSEFNIYGLGLHDKALVQSRTRLRDKGSVLFILSGRYGLDILIKLFKKQKYTFHVLLEKISPHSKKISLESFVKAEDDGNEIFFYTDVTCKNRVSAKTAEQNRICNNSIYYKLYVIQGTPE